MAEQVRHVCEKCGYSIEAWSDGNPYYIDDAGKKQYAYHPDHKRLARCIGNDTPSICLECGYEFTVDSRSPVEECPKCTANQISSTYQLGGKLCPRCKKGLFPDEPQYCAIS